MYPSAGAMNAAAAAAAVAAARHPVSFHPLQSNQTILDTHFDFHIMNQLNMYAGAQFFTHPSVCNRLNRCLNTHAEQSPSIIILDLQLIIIILERVGR